MTSLVDQPENWPVTTHRILGTGRVQTFVEDEITTPQHSSMTRQYATHPGAVAIMAIDGLQRVAVVHQYRHPVAYRLVEPPAGLLDVAGEDYLSAAKRELAEEAQLSADSWKILIDVFTSPGGLGESIRIFLARDLHTAARPDGFVVEDEESDMGLEWLSVDYLVDQIYAGRIQSPSMISGTLALAYALETDSLDRLRNPDAPWPARGHVRRP